MGVNSLPFDRARIADFCRRWKIRRLSLFGSVLRDDFGPDSDVDFLADFDEDERWDAFDEVHMREELQLIVGRPVDLADRRAVESDCNPYRRANITAPTRILYAA